MFKVSTISLLTSMLIMATAEVQANTAANDHNGKTKSEQALKDELKALRARLDALEKEQQQLEAKQEKKEVEIVKKEPAWPIKVHGAVRFQYSYEDFSEGNKERIGDIDFDIFRLNFDGKIGDVILSAEYRWFQYQQAVKHAYLGYNFNDEWQGQVGIVKLPFGNLPYNSHSFFFNSTFYVGLEDEHDAGVKLQYRSTDWDLDFAFLKSDEQGGVDGYVSDRTERYNYDTVGIRLVGEGIYDEPSVAVGESNSWAARAARKWQLNEDETLEVGVSAQDGGLYAGNLVGTEYSAFSNEKIGDRMSFGLHANYFNGPLNIMVQYAEYDYDFDIANSGAVVAAYAFYDTIPTEASIYTANAAYTVPTELGPISSLTFYNDYSLITDKEAYNENTWMNVLGVAVAAGGMYTYVDFVSAKNQPFIGGTIVGESNETQHRLNVNFGFYF